MQSERKPALFNPQEATQALEEVLSLSRKLNVQRASVSGERPSIPTSRKEKAILARGSELVRVAEKITDPSTALGESTGLFEEFMKLLIHPDVEQALEGVSTEIKDQLATMGNAGLVDVGSGGRGGLLIRELAGTYPRFKKTQDVDLKVIYLNPERIEHRSRRWSLNMNIKRYLESHTQFTTCSGIDINHSEAPRSGANVEFLYAESFYGYPDSQGKTMRKKIDRLLDSTLDKEKGSDASLQVVEYFYPSFPRAINVHNSREILDGLHRLSARSPKKWEQVIAVLSDAFGHQKKFDGKRRELVAAKYLTDKVFFNGPEKEEIEKVSAALEDMMESVMYALLRKTEVTDRPWWRR